MLLNTSADWSRGEINVMPDMIQFFWTPDIIIYDLVRSAYLHRPGTISPFICSMLINLIDSYCARAFLIAGIGQFSARVYYFSDAEGGSHILNYN